MVAHLALTNGCHLDAAAVRSYCTAHLEDFKVPRFVVIHDELPKTGHGKIDKRTLSANGVTS